ncbi:MAG: hypothetical protein AMK70_09095 [Nitrospira bacterium SG8_35_1]|nr:MAG: hypothetical protein AMK70_09095 [Nitrospira bacterium SG8_35_1]
MTVGLRKEFNRIIGIKSNLIGSRICLRRCRVFAGTTEKKATIKMSSIERIIRLMRKNCYPV